MTAQKKPSRLASLLIRSVGNSISLQSKESRVCIIAYHRVLERFDPLLESEPDIETFTWQMETLASCFNVLPLHDAIVAIREGRVPPRAVCISFDDGYRSTHDLALPILNRLGLPATVFVTTGYLGSGMMWNDRIVEAVRRLPEGPLDLRVLGMTAQVLSGLDGRRAIANQINDHCKYLPPGERAKVIEDLEKLAGDAPAANLMLTREMIANLARQGMEIGGHTVTHPILTRLDDDAARNEIVENKRVLEEITGQPLRLFAYPNGKVGMDFDQRHVQMVAAAGYSAAFTTAFGAADGNSDVFQLPRGRPWDSGCLMFSARLLQWLWG
jgi:peptidoglycan/xylan/chitin deacetylase (PgdA/CDA1 family)